MYINLCSTCLQLPSISPTEARSPTRNPMLISTERPTFSPTLSPSLSPFNLPIPTVQPNTMPNLSPTFYPTLGPTLFPSLSPFSSPTMTPTISSTPSPSDSPTGSPTYTPTVSELKAHHLFSFIFQSRSQISFCCHFCNSFNPLNASPSLRSIPQNALRHLIREYVHHFAMLSSFLSTNFEFKLSLLHVGLMFIILHFSVEFAQFGHSVSLSNKTLVAGSPEAETACKTTWNLLAYHIIHIKTHAWPYFETHWTI